MHFVPVMFQSSPGPKAGCNQEIATASQVAEQVSILTRPESRMQLLADVFPGEALRVSILTRPESRMQHLL